MNRKPLFPNFSKDLARNKLNTPYDIKAATVLYKFLKRRNPTYKTKTAWATVIRLMREKDKLSKKRIHRIFLWYADHKNDEFTPKVFNAKHFRTKFKAIEAAMSRDPPEIKNTEITKLARKIQSTLTYNWPKSQKKKELRFIQTCLDNYEELKRKMKKVRKTDPQFVDYFLSTFHSPEAFVRKWTAEIWKYFWWLDASKELQSPDKFRLLRHVFHFTNPRFKEISYFAVSHYCGNIQRFDRLIEAMKNV